MYAARAFPAKIASTIVNQTASSAIMPDLAEASSSGIPSRDGPLTCFTLDNRFYQE